MNTLHLQFPDQDESDRLSFHTLASLASRLGMPPEQVVHRALIRFAAAQGLCTPPRYDADDQEVTDEMYQVIHDLVDQRSMRVEKSLFDAFDEK